MKTTSHLDQNPLAIAAQVIADAIMMTTVGTRVMKMKLLGITQRSNPIEFERIRERENKPESHDEPQLKQDMNVA